MSIGKLHPQWCAIAVSLALALAGCSPNTSVEGRPITSGGPVSAASSPLQSFATLDLWNSAVRDAFDKVNATKLRDKKNPEYVIDEGKADADGVAEFFACFDKSPPKCDVKASGKRDGFRKVQFLYDPQWRLTEYAAKYSNGVGKPFVGGYISLVDCGRPKLILQPTYRSSNWIFLEQFSLMVDGTILVDRKFNVGEVERENDHKSVTETTHVVIGDGELLSLRKVDPSKQILIRLTGQKGYVGIDTEGTKAVMQGIIKMLHMYGELEKATVKVGPVKDAACPV